MGTRIQTKTGEVIDLERERKIHDSFRDCSCFATGQTCVKITLLDALESALRECHTLYMSMTMQSVEWVRGHNAKANAVRQAIEVIEDAASDTLDDHVDETLTGYERETNALHHAATDVPAHE